MEFAISTIKIASDWFDVDKETNKYKSINKEEGLGLYLNLFKYRIHQGQYGDHQFVTCIYYLRRNLNWTAEKTYETLAALKKNRVIKIDQYEWRLLKQNNKINERLTLTITATDVPQDYYKDADPDNYYIWLPLSIVDEYIGSGLTYRHIGLYCLISKWSNNTEKKCYMRIEKMADTLGYDKSTVSKMVVDLNRQYFLFSHKVNNKKDGKRYEHRLLKDLKDKDGMIKSFGKYADKVVGDAEKRNEKKRKNRSKNESWDYVEEKEPVWEPAQPDPEWLNDYFNQPPTDFSDWDIEEDDISACEDQDIPDREPALS
jgi:predicted transcriptional regulator